MPLRERKRKKEPRGVRGMGPPPGTIAQQVQFNRKAIGRKGLSKASPIPLSLPWFSPAIRSGQYDVMDRWQSCGTAYARLVEFLLPSGGAEVR
jgi:hypothetical protein